MYICNNIFKYFKMTVKLKINLWFKYITFTTNKNSKTIHINIYIYIKRKHFINNIYLKSR